MATSNPIHKLFLQHQKDVFAYILTLIPNRNDAEDVYQQTCLALLEKQSEYDLNQEFFPWACGFALNEVRRFRRVHYRERVHLDDAVIEALASVQFKSSKQIHDRLDLLMECLDKLPPDKHDLLMQSYSYQGRLVELAKWLRIEIDTLYKRLERIRKSLFECIERGQESPGQ